MPLSRLFSTSGSGGQNGYIKPYKPAPRWGHSAASVNGKLYVWGGCLESLPKAHSSPEKTQLLSYIEVFDPQSRLWVQKHTSGTPPLGVYWNAYSSLGRSLFTFGGYCGHGKCYHNSVHQLDVTSLCWREMMPTNPGKAPMKKWQCGMVAFTLEGESLLCIFGGWGVLSSNHKNMQHEFVADRANLGCVWSNELHFYSLNEGSWSDPMITGSQPPPCQGFTFTMVDSERVVLYGGFQPAGGRRVNDIFILNLSTKHWIKLLSRLNPTIPWPAGRDDHSTCVKDGTCPLMLVVGGVSNQFNTIGDLWILDVDSGKWKQVSAPQTDVGRRGHTTVVFSLGHKHFQLVIYGGISEWLGDKSHREQPMVAETAMLELSENENGEWALTSSDSSTPSRSSSVFDMSEAGVLENDSKHSPFPKEIAPNASPQARPRPRLGRLMSLTLDRRATRNSHSDDAKKQLHTSLSEAATALRKMKQDKEDAEAKQKAAQNMVEELKAKLEEANLRASTAEKRCSQAETLAEEREKSLKDLHLKQASSNDSKKEETRADNAVKQLWLVSRDDVQLTQAEIGHESWFTLKIGSFRGLHVAAKCINNGIVNEGFQSLYSKMMDKAACARHPNLLLFIGATLSPEPIILTELMPTSLSLTLQQGHLSQKQILSISSDIASSLNFLHQWKPSAIIHRNLDPANILLEPMGNNTWRAKLSDYISSNLIHRISALSSSPIMQHSTYTAPEAKTPDLHSVKMDVYSFGVVLIEMCLPNEGKSPHMRLQRIQWPTMTTLIRSCLVLSPTDRPSMADILKRLGRTNESLV